ncbi:hypothetical protein BpHYR1_031240 [Brachionus plicatilis]|uniref:Uncharacterized protein n=1 Tax=Brachionus plicatilis TaxID=10195 RepID=A0A3M7S048_BRAPC|nr:hypothetical protein BpHYR1_031240 [Brachionus plicatilis]
MKGQLSDEEIINQVSKLFLSFINLVTNSETIEVVDEDDQEDEPKQIISKAEFLEMLQKQKVFLLADDNDNLVKKLVEFEKEIGKRCQLYLKHRSVPKHRTSRQLTKNCDPRCSFFSNRAALMWNKLQNEIVNAKTVNRFKNIDEDTT